MMKMMMMMMVECETIDHIHPMYIAHHTLRKNFVLKTRASKEDISISYALPIGHGVHTLEDSIFRVLGF